PPEVSPHTPLPNPLSTTTTTTPRDAVYAESVDNLIGLLSGRMGAMWPDVDGFLKRRTYQTWGAWMKEMLSLITGGNAMEEDLAQVCRDDAALDRPLGSPKGLRTFVANAVRERLSPSSGVPRKTGGVAQRTFENGRKALEGLP
ncbi:MAG TPA: hypothetical protein VN613_05985, partial [Gemmatimonadaceae bacterium]|nr:hypothetical protein [Gemmatimonadaceae bacterium]